MSIEDKTCIWKVVVEGEIRKNKDCIDVARKKMPTFEPCLNGCSGFGEYQDSRGKTIKCSNYIPRG